MKNKLPVILIAVVLLAITVFGFVKYRGAKGTARVAGTATTVPQSAGSNQLPLTIDNYKDGQTLSAGDITLSGTTAPGADVFLNDQETTADAQGKFSFKLSLDEGENDISVSANNASGANAEVNLILNFTPQ